LTILKHRFGMFWKKFTELWQTNKRRLAVVLSAR